MFRFQRFRTRPSDPDVRPTWVLTLALCLAVATGGLVWVGYRATREWERSAVLSVEHRADELLALLIAAIEHDMRGAQMSVLVPINHKSLRLDPPYDLADIFARAFARFPYPESFFVWTDTGRGDGLTYFFNRADRAPTWDTADRSQGPYPVVVLRDPPAVRTIVAEARRQASYGTWFVTFEAVVSGIRYQTVVHLLYDSSRPTHLTGLAGFTVNLSWVRQQYFGEIVQQVRRIGGGQDSLGIEILDERGVTIAATDTLADDPPPSTRSFPLIFFDHAVGSSLPFERPLIREWRARVSPAKGRTLLAVGRGARQALVLIGLAALVTIGALGMTVQAARAAAQLSTMKSEFVSTVTHDLKTPLALIRLVADTLEKGRYTSPQTIADYARLLSLESGHLTRLIDNLLTYAHISDAKRLYRFEPVEMLELVQDVLERFHPRLIELGFEVKVDVPVDLPRVRADRQLMGHVVDNLIDNAIKYGKDGRMLIIRAYAADGRVSLEVADRGQGIPSDEVSRVFDKFYRGRRAREGGSGLGLAIAHRIVRDHGGEISLRSIVGEGTSVAVVLLVSQAA